MSQNKADSITSIFEKLWSQYSRLNPQVLNIKAYIEGWAGNVKNDHVAFRTVRAPGFGIQPLAHPFLELGYQERGEYHFSQKKLFAKHLEHPNAELPKVFISELVLEQCSQSLQDWMNQLFSSTRDYLNFGNASDQLLTAGRLWPAPSYTDYLKHYSESEYAAWFSVYGFCANHFTVLVNSLTNNPSLESLNEFIKGKGFVLNQNGGEIKGTPDELLEQSSTMAHKIDIEFSDGTHQVPSVYYEFAKRYLDQSGHLFQGFVTQSADKIFESTNR